MIGLLSVNFWHARVKLASDVKAHVLNEWQMVLARPFATH
jgi:hypothetical protein